MRERLKLGRSFHEALAAWEREVGGDEALLLGAALRMHHRSGGSLTTVLESLAVSIRDRLDVAAEVRSLTAQARLSAIVDSAMDAVITVDRNQTIVLFNKAAESLFGLAREEALGSSLERLLPNRFRAAHHGHVERFGRTGVTSRKMGDVTTLLALRADGTEFPIEASISHTTEAEGLDRNFAGMFPFIDLAFGTFYMPVGRVPERFGITGAPVPSGFLAQLVYPFRNKG